MQIFVNTISGETIALDDGSSTVANVKESIEEIEGIPTQYQRLVFEGKELEDDRELSYYNIQNKSTIHLSMKLDGGYFYGPRHLIQLAHYHTMYKKICRKCYCRLPPQATRCRKAKCGRTDDLRYKKFFFKGDLEMFKRNKKYKFVENE